jgi:hypothetical protein
MRVFERSTSLVSAVWAARPIAVECCVADSSRWHFAQTSAPTYFASGRFGLHVVGLRAPPALIEGPCAREGRRQKAKTKTTKSDAAESFATAAVSRRLGVR